jgi:hypothetical protein
MCHGIGHSREWRGGERRVRGIRPQRRMDGRRSGASRGLRPRPRGSVRDAGNSSRNPTCRVHGVSHGGMRSSDRNPARGAYDGPVMVHAVDGGGDPTTVPRRVARLLHLTMTSLAPEVALPAQTQAANKERETYDREEYGAQNAAEKRDRIFEVLVIFGLLRFFLHLLPLLFILIFLLWWHIAIALVF